MGRIGRVGLLFSPPILTNIWMVSAGSEVADDSEDDRERMVDVGVGLLRRGEVRWVREQVRREME